MYATLYNQLLKKDYRGLFPQHSSKVLEEATRIIREHHTRYLFEPITSRDIREDEIFAEQTLEMLRLKEELKLNRRTFVPPVVYMVIDEDSRVSAAVKFIAIGKNFRGTYRFSITYKGAPYEETRRDFFAQAAEMLRQAEENPFRFFN